MFMQIVDHHLVKNVFVHYYAVANYVSNYKAVDLFR